MNIFNVYTRKTLRLNRTRTIVTIIGIMLSVALFTAVTEGAASGREYMVRVAQEQTGSFSAFYTDMDSAEYADLQGDPEVAAYTAMDVVGYADIGSTNEAKPYLYIEAVPANFSDLVSVQLTAGRMPENDTEVLLPSHLYSNGGVKYSLGDELTLDVGERTWEGETLTQNNPYSEGETLTNTAAKTYTVVGFYERFDYLIEDYSAPGYTALTGGSGTGSYTVFFSLHHPGSTYEYLDASGRSAAWYTNSDLLYYYGTATNNRLLAVLYGLVAVLLGLILFGSVALIYNAFSISVSERTKQFGLLKSVGATNRQIMHTVLYEALVLCAAAIPLGLLVGCAGIGITLYALRDTFSAVLDNGTQVKMQLVLNAPALVTAGAVGLVTALISAWIPARRAVRINAIDAIRQSRDISVGRRQVRTSRLTAKLFGFEGMLAAKNFKRSRRQYRSTVVSMFLSVVLFISASSFCAYLTNSVDTAVDEPAYDLTYYTEGKSEGMEALYQSLLSAGGVTSGTYLDSYGLTARVGSDELTEDYKNPELGYTDESSDVQLIYIRACFVEDGTFRQLLAENGLDEGEYFSADKPKALLYDHTTAAFYDDSGSKWFSYSTLKERELPYTLEYVEAADIEGYQFCYTFTDENGETMYAYLDEQKLGTGEATEQDWLYKPAEEVELVSDLTVGAVLDNGPYFAGSGVVLIYPYSLEEAVMGKQMDGTTFYFTAADHSEAYDNMLTILSGSGHSTAELYDLAASGESNRALVTVINVFSYGFIILISLIAVANVFNTISTNIALRRREFAMLRSVGMTQRGFGRMMNYECLLYGFKGLLYGLPASFGITWLIYQAVRSGFDTDYYVPWTSVAIAVASVFLVVFVTIVYSMDKIKKDNPIDALKNENL